MDDLGTRIKKLLNVAPSDVYLIRKQSTKEILVIHGKAVWLAISEKFDPPKHEFIVREWTDTTSVYTAKRHFFDCEWSFKTWLYDAFLDLKVSA